MTKQTKKTKKIKSVKAWVIADSDNFIFWDIDLKYHIFNSKKSAKKELARWFWYQKSMNYKIIPVLITPIVSKSKKTLSTSISSRDGIRKK